MLCLLGLLPSHCWKDKLNNFSIITFCHSQKANKLKKKKNFLFSQKNNLKVLIPLFLTYLLPYLLLTTFCHFFAFSTLSLRCSSFYVAKQSKRLNDCNTFGIFDFIGLYVNIIKCGCTAVSCCCFCCFCWFCYSFPTHILKHFPRDATKSLKRITKNKQNTKKKKTS